MGKNSLKNETADIQAMYENAPYPDLGDDLKSMDMYWNARIKNPVPLIVWVH